MSPLVDISDIVGIPLKVDPSRVSSLAAGTDGAYIWVSFTLDGKASSWTSERCAHEVEPSAVLDEVEARLWPGGEP